MTKTTRMSISLFAGVALLALSVASAGPGERVCHPWCATLAEVSSDTSLRLEQASYEVDLFGAVAVGSLVQEFRNDSDRVLTAQYRYSAPRGLRPNALEMTVDGQEIENVALERKTKPNSRGQRTTSKANRKTAGIQAKPVEVPAGARVTIRTRFQTTLPIDEGRIRLSLPAINAKQQAEASGPIPTSFTVVVHHDEPLAVAESRTHDLFVAYEGDRTMVELADGVDLSASDFELELAIGPEDDPTLLGFVGREVKGTREVLAVLTPPSKPNRETIRPKQVVFVLDTSGSMAKGKLEQAKQALYASLLKLTEKDTFNIIEFDGAFTAMSPKPIPRGDAGIDNANRWLQSQRAGGRTRLVPALTAAFALSDDAGRHRMTVILTDGNVQDPREVEALLRQKLDGGRLFVVGIGEDVRQENILRFAEYGRGLAAFVADPEDLDKTLGGLFDSVSEPLAWDLDLDLGNAEIERIKPSRLPDLYAGRPVTIRLQVRGELPSELKIHTETMSGPRTFAVVLIDSEEARLTDR